MKFFRFFSSFILLCLVFSNLQAEDNSASFKPAWWCPGGHFQTIYGGLFRATPDLALRRERIELPDGDFLDLDWLDGNARAPIVVVLHGLGSSAHVPYVLLMLEEIQKSGWRAVALNARGSLESNRLLETTHAGKSEDLDSVIAHLVETKTADRIYLIGYSLGGNVVLKWLGEKGETVPAEIVKAAVISVPYDLEKAAHNLDQGFNRHVYTRVMLDQLKAQTSEKAKHFPDDIHFENVKNMTTFQAYDREITARLNGFRDERDYWTQSSSVNYLGNIKVPALLIHAANDPFLPEKDLPLEKINGSAHLELVLASDGGHLGFISGNHPFRSEKWLEPTILSFFNHE